MEFPLYNQNAESVGKIELPEEVFGVKMNKDLLHQVAVSQTSNMRQNLAHTKTRAEVRGGGVKPWKQKGTGRARHGSIRSPIWVGGGVAHGPTKFRNFKKKINRKMLKKALGVALSGKVKDKEILFLDAFKLENTKTKDIATIFKNIKSLLVGGKLGSTLLVLPANEKDIVRCSKNLKWLETIEAKNLSVLDTLSHKNMVVLKDSVEVLKNIIETK
jgi:large subunit ribosomal protein L4